MEDEQGGFRKMSEIAGDPTPPKYEGAGIAVGAKVLAGQVSEKLKSAGIDADGAIDIAEQRVTELQDMLIREIQERPFRALGWAAAAGLILGIMTAR